MVDVRLPIMGLLAFLAVGLAGCLAPRPDKGDLWAEKLHIGMSSADVQAVIGEPKVVLPLGGFRYLLYLGERVPYDLLHGMPDDTNYLVYPYPVSSMTDHALCLFFDDNDRLRGWVKDHSDLTREKFLHEKLTSQVAVGMSRAKIHAIIGKPDAVVPLPRERSPEYYEDRYWTKPPLDGFNKQMDVHAYELESGKRRHVFLIYNNKSQLYMWGYDHAHEEAERYLAEQAARKSK